MKYLKSYKLYESVSDIRNVIKDILIEIEDIGYEISIYSTDHSHSVDSKKDFNEIKIFIEKPNDDLESYLSSSDNYKPTQEFVDSLQHLISWANENNFVYSIESKKNGSLFKQYKSSEDIESITQDEINYITIIFRLPKNISESIKISDYKKWSKETNKTFFDEMGQYFERFTNHDKNFYRIYFDLDVNTDDFKVVIPDEIEDFFTWFGPDGPYQTQMEIIDYQKGICTDKEGRQMRIGKLLNKLGEEKLLQTYNKSKENTLKNISDLQVVISRHPYDIIGMSTDRGWTTCHDLDDKRYGGDHLYNISRYLRRGTLAAYVIRKPDRNISNPISRCLIQKSYLGLKVDDHVYGTNVPGFTNFLENWIKEYNKSK